MKRYNSIVICALLSLLLALSAASSENYPGAQSGEDFLAINLLTVSYSEKEGITSAITAITGKNAICRYSEKDAPFDSLANSMESDGKVHNGYAIYAENNEGIYYVKCKSTTSQYASASIPFKIKIQDNICQESWACNGWGECSNGFQERECIDLNKCGNENGKPKEFQTCSIPCNEVWQCEAWSACSENTKQRRCYDLNDCKTEQLKPAEYGICGNNQCYNSIKDENEEDIDCGGICESCSASTCFDRIQNHDENGIDCGGKCRACNSADFIATGEIIKIVPEQPPNLSFFMAMLIGFLLLFSIFGIYRWYNTK